jgi:hypothetical protein
MKNKSLEELNDCIDNVYDIIYKDLNLDNVRLSNELKRLYRNAIKSEIYKIQIGDYYIDMNPENINVCYDSKDTYIEINKNDQVIETHRPIDVKYYVISQEEKDTYPLSTPCVKVSGEALCMDGIRTDNRFIELLNPKFEMRLKYYVTDEVMLDTITRGTTIREVDPNDLVIDPIVYFKENQLIPVKLNYFEKNFSRITERSLRPNYKKHFPRTAGKVKIIKEMLNSLIEFYNSFNV